ncbi:LANO_0H01838g1_1 [Lachancea nothofagi CBS 11611]|uniref:LANO_0H01838g1_1 n=1 Tax=Lachancea nothofagi CBS 11611 TaxID=1266666 RepID=A0A1G4KKU7_9SACH|nr:LANO_0H01838g1_1 [Lachancea nothofagi CBS 11611]
MRLFVPAETQGPEQNSQKRHKSTADQGSGHSAKMAPYEEQQLCSEHINLVSRTCMSTLFAEHAHQKLPYCDDVFPWLHGLSGSREVPRACHWMAVIRSQPLSRGMIENSGLLRSSLDPHEFLMPWDYKKHCIESILSDVRNNLGLNSEEHELLTRACKLYKLMPFLVTDATAQGIYGAGAAKNRVCTSSSYSQPPQGWKQPGMFRRFDLQVAKFIEMSQRCVIYCLSESRHWRSCHCQELAVLLYAARKSLDPSENFQISILDTTDIDPIWWGTPPMKLTALQKDRFSQLASDFDIASFSNWDRDLFYRERLEISRMSSATCVSSESSTWCGNSTDFEIYRLNKGLSAQENDKVVHSMEKVHQEVDTVVTLPNLSRKAQSSPPIDNLLFSFPQPSKTWELFIHCTESSTLPELSTIVRLLERIKKDATIPHTVLSFPISGSIGLGNLNLASIKVILNTCLLIYSTGKCTNFGSLIYCSDGYTEVSFILVAFLIFAWDLPLDEVLFRLHKDCQRPFFLFPIDLQVLGHLQVLLREESPKRKEHDTTCLDVDPDLFSKMFFTKFRDSYHLAQLKGPLPSKILPHLYLGSLEHAQNPKLLQKLEIKNIVSVGETMPWLLAAMSRRRSLTVSEADTRGVTRPFISTVVSSSQITRVRASSLVGGKEGPNVVEENGFRVLHITDLDDNGEDRLLSQLDDILAFIDECYNRGEKVLVHCMVGVSRSATVCIAECMRRLNCDVLRAYLYVRVRRLNIIIQPNLMFVYELCKWQEAQGKPLTVDWHIICRAISELNRMYF